MTKAACQWCCSIVDMPDNYDRRQHTPFCGKDCIQKEWLFKKWQSDFLLTLVREYHRGKTKNQSQQSSDKTPKDKT